MIRYRAAHWASRHRTWLSYLILAVLGCPTFLTGKCMYSEGTHPETAVKCSFTGSIGPSTLSGLLIWHLCFLLLLILLHGSHSLWSGMCARQPGFWGCVILRQEKSPCKVCAILSSRAGIAPMWLRCKIFRLSSPDSLVKVLGVCIRGRTGQPGSSVYCELHTDCSTMTGRIFLGDKVW